MTNPFARTARTRQPKTACLIDWSNPITHGLVSTIHYAGGLDAVYGSPLSINGTINRVPVSDALTSSAGTNGGAHSVSGRVAGVSTGPLTDFVLVNDHIAVGGTVYLYGCGTYDGGSNGCGIALEHSGIANKWGAIDLGSNLPLSMLSSNEFLPAGRQFLVHTRNGSTHRIYRNGQLIASASGSSGNASGTSRFVQNNLMTTGGTFSSVSRIGISGRYNRALSADEVAELARNPWQIFKRRGVSLFVPLSTGGTLNASASGSAAASGTADISADVGLAAIGVAVASGSATPSAAIPVTAAGLAVSGGSANAVATVSIAAADLAQAAGQAGLSATVLMQAAGAAQASGNATLAATLQALASGSAQASGSATLSGGAPGALSASGGAEVSGQAVLTVSVQLAATGAAQAGGSATGSVSAPGSISASGGAIASGFSTWSALVTLTAAGFVQAMGSGSFVVDVPLAATGQATAGGQASPSMAGAAGGCWLHALAPRRATLAIADDYRLTRIVHGVTRV